MSPAGTNITVTEATVTAGTGTTGAVTTAAAVSDGTTAAIPEPSNSTTSTPAGLSTTTIAIIAGASVGGVVLLVVVVVVVLQITRSVPLPLPFLGMDGVDITFDTTKRGDRISGPMHTPDSVIHSLRLLFKLTYATQVHARHDKHKLTGKFFKCQDNGQLELLRRFRRRNVQIHFEGVRVRFHW